MSIGILTYDNGEYDVYVAFFDDAERLKKAVRLLNERRLDRETGDPADLGAMEEALLHVPDDWASDEYLDALAAIVNDTGHADIETALDARERAREELEERGECGVGGCARADMHGGLHDWQSPGQEPLGLAP